MLIQDIKNNIHQFENFEIWEVSDLNDFFKGNGILKLIFEKEYNMKLEALASQRDSLPESDLALMSALLDMVADKYFFVFTHHDPNHFSLIELQASKVMNFGLDIAHVSTDKVYILIMDKLKKVSVGL